MFKQFVEWANANAGICGLILCAIGAGFLVVYVIDRKSRKSAKRKMKQLKMALETKQKRIFELEEEVWALKVDLFAARQDGKIEVKKRDSRIQQLEQDKKQLTKWGTEK